MWYQISIAWLHEMGWCLLSDAALVYMFNIRDGDLNTIYLYLDTIDQITFLPLRSTVCVSSTTEMSAYTFTRRKDKIFIQFWHFSFSHSGIFCIDVLFGLVAAAHCSPWSSGRALTGGFCVLLRNQTAFTCCVYMRCFQYVCVRGSVSVVWLCAACSSTSHRACQNLKLAG